VIIEVPAPHIEAPEPRHVAEPDLVEKGLQHNAVDLFRVGRARAYAYRSLNRVAPDAGTSFTWTVKAFGPHVGWLCGWGLVVATIIVLSNLAGVAVTFFYLFLAEVAGVVMLVWQARSPSFFRGETLRHDTPALSEITSA
jgi:hypothetical protein